MAPKLSTALAAALLELAPACANGGAGNIALGAAKALASRSSAGGAAGAKPGRACISTTGSSAGNASKTAASLTARLRGQHTRSTWIVGRSGGYDGKFSNSKFCLMYLETLAWLPSRPLLANAGPHRCACKTCRLLAGRMVPSLRWM